MVAEPFLSEGPEPRIEEKENALHTVTATRDGWEDRSRHRPVGGSFSLSPFSSALGKSVIIEAESGMIGSDFTTGSDSGVAYITTVNNHTSSDSPGLATRVATYEVTFPSAGTYNLFGRIRVGAGAFDEDSMFAAGSFGLKSSTTGADWVWLNGLADKGYTGIDEVVDGGGGSGAQVWKWLDLTASGGAPSYPGPAETLIQSFQVGSREDGLQMDKLVFGEIDVPFPVGHLNTGTTPVEVGQIFGSQLLGNYDVRIQYYGVAGAQYAEEWTDSLLPVVTWTPSETNAADSAGLVTFTSTPEGSQEFARIHDVTVPAPVTGLGATAGPGEVYLSWMADRFAASYNVRKATVCGGPYTTITNVTTTSVLDDGLVNETPYFYVVSALNANGERANSAEMTATPSINISMIPLVYAGENTGAGYPPPPLADSGDLPIVEPLADPFMWSATDPYNYTNATGRFSNFADWSRRRSEIKAEIEKHEIGVKPAVDLADISASFSGGTHTVRVTNPAKGRTLTLTSGVSFPSGSGPPPLMIGMSGFLSIDLGGRPITSMTYDHDQVTTYGDHSTSDPYYQLYANLGLNTAYTVWSLFSDKHPDFGELSRLLPGLMGKNGACSRGATRPIRD